MEEKRLQKPRKRGKQSTELKERGVGEEDREPTKIGEVSATDEFPAT